MYVPYLENLKFTKTKFKADGSNDHEHCDLCWVKISEYPDDIHEAYSSNQGQFWVCPECYEKYHESYHWSLIQN